MTGVSIPLLAPDDDAAAIGEMEDPRPRQAIEQARAWVRGEITMSQARTAGGHAMATARDLRGAARHAAYAAGRVADLPEDAQGVLLEVEPGTRGLQQTLANALRQAGGQGSQVQILAARPLCGLVRGTFGAIRKCLLCLLRATYSNAYSISVRGVVSLSASTSGSPLD